jgi:glycosyltransferase involved in cell wall biosynthesis
MKILLVHNSYQQPGGEDIVFEQERQLLESAGHAVVAFHRANQEIAGYSAWQHLGLVKQTVWAGDVKNEITALLRQERPDVVHVHNTLPMISPSIYWACREAGTPVVQTLHNYRLLCSASTLFRSGKICEECVEHSLWRGIRYGCYRNSRAATATVAVMLAAHRALGTWTQVVDCYLALTEFARQKFIAAGLPQEKVMIKPNCLYCDPGTEDGTRKYALFVGRLAAVKGLPTMLLAWARLHHQIPLLIVGDSPLRPQLETQAKQFGLTSICFMGQLPREQTLAMMKAAQFLVFPSEWYEGFPMALVEAFACGTPVLCSRLGGLPDIVADGRTGLHFTSGDADDLARKVEWAWANPQALREMGRNARAEYEAKYTAERNYQMLMEIYQRVLDSKGAMVPKPASGGVSAGVTAAAPNRT